MKIRSSRWCSIALLLGVLACGSPGTDDAHDHPRGAAGSSGVQGGSDNSSGAAGNADQAGSADQGGPDSSSAGQGGSAGESGGSDNGGIDDAAGAAGVTQPRSPVHGRVIDFWGHELSGVPVQIDGKKATTDASGGFSLDDVSAEYDASLVVQYPKPVTQTDAYLYQGLTRRDPTLQVFRAYADSSANLETPLSNSEQWLTSGRILGVAMAGKDGNFDRQYSSPGGASIRAKWVGPATTTESVFGLLWQPNATSRLPEGYFAFAKTTVMLDSGNPMTVLFDLDMAPQAIATTTVSGSVSQAGAGTRSNTLFVRFPSGANIRVANTNPTSSSFSYLVPMVAEASVAFAAADGCGVGSQSCAIVHEEHALGAALGDMSIPSPASGLALNPPGAVNANTKFSFNLPPETQRASVSIFDNSAGNDRLIVIHRSLSFKLPMLINGTYSLAHGASYTWAVTSHGEKRSVDDMASASGYIDSFGLRPAMLEPDGPSHDDGTYTASASELVTIAD